jgi:hypothetical protein
MLRKRVIPLAAVVAAAAATVAGVAVKSATAIPQPGLKADVVDIERPVSINKYPTTDFGSTSSQSDDRTGKTSWRVVQGTGNCCENYVTSTKAGRLLDFGGTYINFSDDRGKTWKQVRPQTPLVNGEGTIDLAPNGDVIAIGWDPYSGDHLQSFKYDALSQTWYWFEEPLHQPFDDREWVTVIPGPFSIDGRTYPYISFLKGGYPWKELWLYSTDGITYTDASSKFIDDTLGSSVEGALPTHADATFDWIQPNTNAGMTALGDGGVLAAGDLTTDWSLFDRSTMTWSKFTFPGGHDPAGLYQIDSAGRVHNVVPSASGFDYRISTDGGDTWKSTSVSLPPHDSIDQIDFRANRQAGVAAVAIHALNSQTTFDEDYVYKFDIRSNDPFLKRLYTVGLGDTGSAAGVGNSVRMDFQTITIFKDGRVAVSFLDSTTHYPSPTTGQEQTRPALAIEQKTALP